MRGLLVDLELNGPDPSRYTRLRSVLTNEPNRAAPIPKNTNVTLDYTHFGEFEGGELDDRAYDFVVLSPQGTPWHRYRGPAADRLTELGNALKRAVQRGRPAILGICGGHQFLALAFGGTVDFIDPAYAGTFPERYPKEALSERGVTTLRILAADPIFEGVSFSPGMFRAVESHYEEVKTVPAPFVNLARSEMSPIQVIRIPGRIVYGFAFHPERCLSEEDCPGATVPEGGRLLANFLAMTLNSNR